MRPLLTIDDLLASDPADAEHLIARAMGISAVYDQVVAADKGDGHLRAPGIHASELQPCKRRVVYSLLGEERREQTPLIWKKRFKIGHSVHDLFQKEFEKMARKTNYLITFEKELAVCPSKEQPKAAEWSIFSHCDGVFTVREAWDGPAIARVVLEIKTASPDEFEKLKGPKQEHIDQAHIYMACLNVPLVWYLYYNKGNQNFTPSDNPSFFQRFDPTVWARIERRMEECHIHAADKNLPPREETIVCNFCAFSWTCKPAITNHQHPLRVIPPQWSGP